MLKDIVTTASEDSRFSQLIMAIHHSQLGDELSEIDGLTLFGPIDKAFVRSELGNRSKDKGHVDELRELLLAHVVRGRVTIADLKTLKSLQTMRGNTIKISYESDVVRVGSSQVLVADIVASNGIIHVIDRVLSPSAIARAD